MFIWCDSFQTSEERHYRIIRKYFLPTVTEELDASKWVVIVTQSNVFKGRFLLTYLAKD